MKNQYLLQRIDKTDDKIYPNKIFREYMSAINVNICRKSYFKILF